MNTSSSRVPTPRRGNARRIALATTVALAGGVLGASAAGASSGPRPSVKLRHGELLVTGTKRTDVVALRLSRFSRQLLVVDLGDDGWPDAVVPRGWVQRITISTQGGDDRVWIDDSFGPFTDARPTTIDSGDGHDVIVGGLGAETLASGAGDDSVDGGGGDDDVRLGRGDDAFRWEPGHGNDRVDGGDGHDALAAGGHEDADVFSLAPDGAGGLTLARDVDAATVQVARIERVALATAAGSDIVHIEDLSAGTGARAIAVDTGTDGSDDSVVLTGSPGDDRVTVAGAAGALSVSGLAVTVDVTGDPDTGLALNTFDGDDTVDSVALAAGDTFYVVDTGAGDDTVVGGPSAEIWFLEDGDDTADAGGGNDEVFGGYGNDVLRGADGDDYLDGGDDEDVLVGGAGEDRLANGEDVTDD